MMTTLQIENQELIATFDEKGAELISLKAKETGLEYIWHGDPTFWGRHAPVLFPIVGRLKEDQYKYKGQTYPMSQHGFARDQVFEIAEHTKERIAFRLMSSADTKAIYPFDFELILSYELTVSGLMVYYQVNNPGTESLYFAIGGHPAFNVPLEEGLDFEDYYLHFSPQKSRAKIPLKGAYIQLAEKTLGQTNIDMQLSRSLFEHDAMIYETKGLNSISIQSDKSPHSVTLTYNDMPYVGIWSPYPQAAPFVCIEPWCGIADTVDASGELTEKYGINCLAAQETFKQKYCITVK